MNYWTVVLQGREWEVKPWKNWTDPRVRPKYDNSLLALGEARLRNSGHEAAADDPLSAGSRCRLLLSHDPLPFHCPDQSNTGGCVQHKNAISKTRGKIQFLIADFQEVFGTPKDHRTRDSKCRDLSQRL
jgi:hypothetical protein